MSKVVKGDRTSIYSILAYVLAKLPQLKKRAYVAKYLMAVEVPPEFMHDEGVVVRSQLHTLRAINENTSVVINPFCRTL